MKPDQESVRKALLNAQQALQQGNRQVARGWAQKAVALDPDSEEPWLFLAAVASPRASINYLKQAQKINPQSQSAQQGMEWAVERLRREQAKQLQKIPLLTVSQSVPSANLQMPKSGSIHRWSRSLKRFFSHWQNWIGILLVSFFLFVALAAPLISPNGNKSPDPFMKVKGAGLVDPEPHSPLLAPPLGTLPGQYDVFHALVWGTRDALAFGLEVVILTGIFGVLFGAIAGYAGGKVNNIMMRIADAFLVFPIIAGVVLLNQLWISVTVAAGGFFDSYHHTWIQNVGKLTSFIQILIQAVNPLLLILILFSWMPYARIINVVVVTLKQAEFIQAARAIGAKSSRIILRHLVPNSVTPSIVLAARDVGSMVILQATFTFIGLDGSSTWGKMLVMGKDWILGPGGGIIAYWWVYVPATLVLILFGIGWNLLGDGLSELLDPRD